MRETEILWGLWAGVNLAYMPVSAHLLNQFPLLQPLPSEVMVQLSETMYLRDFPRRSMVLGKDAASQGLGFLVEGRLQGVDFTVDGRSVGLYFVDAGDYFGELSVVDGQPAAELVVAATKSTVAFLDALAARELIFGQPALARAVMVRMAQRIRTVTAQRILLGLPNPFQRLCVLLLQLCEHSGEATPTIRNVPTHQELAIMINASRETVTRAFQVLFAQAFLVRDGNDLRILEVARVRDIGEGRSDPPRS